MAEAGDWIAVADRDALAEGEPVPVDVGGHPMVLVRLGDAVHAVDGACPHKFGPLAEGAVNEGTLECPLHHARFDLATGDPVPGCAWAGRLPVHAVHVEDGRVLVRLSGA